MDPGAFVTMAVRSAVLLALPLVAAAAAAAVVVSLLGRLLGWTDPGFAQIARLVAVVTALSAVAGTVGEGLGDLLRRGLSAGVEAPEVP